MPELPEVETTCRGIEPHIRSRRVTKVVVRQPKLRWPVDDVLVEQLPESTVLEVRRRAKYVLVETTSGCLIVHLGMSGSLRVLPTAAPLKKHDHIDIEFEHGQLLRYTDPRRFGSMHFIPLGESVTEHFLIRDLGPEPLSDDFDGMRLYSRGRGRKQAVKNFIMDGHTVVGVGNIYASEALFAAGIRPTTAAGRISLVRYQRLAATIKEVLQASITQGGTTLRDFTGAEGNPGYFKQRLRVYERAGQPCRDCGSVIERLVIGQRASYFCPKCQR